MVRPFLAVCILLLAGLTATAAPVHAQLATDAGSARPAAPAAAPSGMPSPAPATSAESAPRPAPGPSVRERGRRRSTGGSTASGALMIFMIVAGLGYYVIKRMRR